MHLKPTTRLWVHGDFYQGVLAGNDSRKSNSGEGFNIAQLSGVTGV
jgi:hypothetical protein